MSNKPLSIPKSKKLKGLKVYCYECKSAVDAVCKKSGAAIATCKHGNDHVFKAFAHVPGTSKGRKTRALDTRDLEEARRLTLEFQQAVKEATIKTLPLSAPVLVRIEQAMSQTMPSSPEQPKATRSCNLIELMAQYVCVLQNDPELVPEHRVKERSDNHVKDVERTFRYLIVSLANAGHAVNDLHVDQLTDKMIGTFHAYLLKTHKFSAASYNRAMSMMTSFYTYIDKNVYRMPNPFITVSRKPTNPNKEVIKQYEYKALLDILEKPELGIQVLSTGERKNLHKPWMKDAVTLGITTGRRIEEIALMQWNNLIHDEEGAPLYIKTPDYKVNRQKKLPQEQWKYRYTPINEDLLTVLMTLGYESRKDSNAYILAPDEPMSRQTIRRFLTRSFTHYYNQLNTGRRLTFKNLRKTYITELSDQQGIDNAQHVTGHSSTQVMKDHYIDERTLASTAKQFSLFKKEKQKESERENAKGKSSLER